MKHFILFLELTVTAPEFHGKAFRGLSRRILENRAGVESDIEFLF